MPLAMFVNYGTPVLLLGLIIMNVAQSILILDNRTKFKEYKTDMCDEMKDLKKNIVWRETYIKDVERINRIEHLLNGRLK